MCEPSGLVYDLETLITTAFTTSPFFTLDDGTVSLTEATMMSPKLAYFLPLPPGTPIQLIVLAPELSAIFNFVYC